MGKTNSPEILKKKKNKIQLISHMKKHFLPGNLEKITQNFLFSQVLKSQTQFY